MMRKYLAILLLSIFVFANSNFRISAEGIGVTKEIAKKDALNAIAQQIITKINSTQTSTKKSINGNLFSSFKSHITTKSNVLLKGINYLYTKKNNIQYATAIFDYSSLDETLKYLMSSINPENIGTTRKYNNEKLQNLIKICNFAKAILYYPKVSDIYPNTSNFKRIILQQIKQSNKRLDGYGSIELSSNIKNASIIIGNQKYKTNKEIFLKAGRHIIYMKKPNYKTIKLTFNLSSGEYLERKVDFIKDITNQIPVKISIDGIDDFNLNTREFNKMLFNYNMKIAHKSDLYLKFHYKEDIQKNGVFIKVKSNIKLEIYKNNNLIKEYSSSKTFKASKKSLDKKQKNNIMYLLSKLSKKASSYF